MRQSSNKVNIEQTIRDYLPQIIHMSLATCVNNKPWVCEVHYVFDSELNLYFRSKLQRRHSKEIEINATVAGNIVTQHLLEQEVRGVYFEGTAKIIDDIDENHIAYTLYCERFNTDSKILEEAKKETGHRFYKITVDTFYLFDSRESSPSKKYELKWKKSYESPLVGGRTAKEIVRIENTVHRSVGPNPEVSHTLLKILEEKGFDHAPRFLGMDEEGREIVTFINGEVSHGKINWTDDQLIKISQMLKDFHNATAGSTLAAGKEVVCHNDIAPWNTILENNVPTAFIDFDEAAPGNRIDDFAYFLWTFLELGSDIPVDTQVNKVRMLCEAYGSIEKSALIDAILRQQERILSKRGLLVENARDQESREFSVSRIDKIRLEIEWVKANRCILEATL